MTMLWIEKDVCPRLYLSILFLFRNVEITKFVVGDFYFLIFFYYQVWNSVANLIPPFVFYYNIPKLNYFIAILFIYYL